MDGYPPTYTSPFGDGRSYPTPSAPWPTSYTANPSDPLVAQIENALRDHKTFWGKLALGAKAGIILTSVITLVLLIVISAWYCCGCCGLRRAHARRNELRNPRPDTDTVPLYHQQTPTMSRLNSAATTTVPMREVHAPAHMTEAPPPSYAEITPPQHTFIAGGITHVRDEEEGVISDGKTPLSEIPFEDVVLDHGPSTSSSARNFGSSHLGLGGDTTGHTNS